MKKLFFIFLMLLFVAPAMAWSEQVDLKATWEQAADYDRVTKWVIYYGTTAGGPYTELGELTKAEAESSGLIKDFVIEAPPEAASEVIPLYFVVVAFDGELFSGNSNEVEYFVDVRQPPADPVNLKVTITIVQ